MNFENDDLPQRINALHTASDKVLVYDGASEYEYAIVYEGVIENGDCVDESAPEDKQFFSEYYLEQTLMDSNGEFYSRHMQSNGIRYYGGDNKPEPECDDIKELKNIVWSDVAAVDNVQEHTEFYLGLTVY